MQPWIAGVLAGSHIELPTVPGARHDGALQLTSAQRPTLMRTDTVQGEDLLSDVKQGHNPVVHHALLSRTRGALTQ
jgi:hypothetical protein